MSFKSNNFKEKEYTLNSSLNFEEEAEPKFKKVNFIIENIEEEKGLNNSPIPIKLRSFSEKKKGNINNISYNKTEENSFLNFLENNSFVKMNKKNLQNQNTKKELILPISNKDNNIKKDLIFNENQLILNYQRINDLEEGK